MDRFWDYGRVNRRETTPQKRDHNADVSALRSGERGPLAQGSSVAQLPRHEAMERTATGPRSDHAYCSQDGQRRLCDHPKPRAAIGEGNGDYCDNDGDHHDHKTLTGSSSQENCPEDNKGEEHPIQSTSDEFIASGCDPPPWPAPTGSLDCPIPKRMLTRAPRLPRKVSDVGQRILLGPFGGGTVEGQVGPLL